MFPAEARYIGYAEDPLEIGIGARSMALGRTFVASRNCANSVFNNPATMSDNPNFTFTTMLGKLLGDVSYNVISYTTPLSLGKIKGTLGLGYLSSSTGPIITPTQSGFSQFTYSSNIKILSYSKQNLGACKSFSVGARLKLFEQGFSGDVNYAGSGMDLDLGILHTPDPKTSVGLLLKNVLPMGLGGKITFPNGDEESFPMSYRIGVTSRHLNPDLLLALDYDSYAFRNYPATLHFGAEYKLGDFMVLRGGIDQTASAGSVTSSPTYGVAIFLDPSFRISYAYHPYSDNSGNFNQYLSIVYEPFTKKETAAPKAVSEEAQPKLAPPSEQLPPLRTPVRITLPEVIKIKKTEIITRESVIKKAKKLPVKPFYFTALSTLTPSETYKVKNGDTLSGIATKHYRLTDPMEIDRATQTVALFNNIADPDKLVLSEIKLPKVKALKKGEKFPGLEKIIGGETYTVRPGENLNRIISRHYGFSDPLQISQAINIIAQFNQLDPDQIQAGQRLRLLKKSEMMKALEGTSALPGEIVSGQKPLIFSVPLNLREYYSYKVRPGETLSKIIVKAYRITNPKEIATLTEIIAKINNLQNPDMLRKGEIKLPKLGKILPGIKPMELDGLFETKTYTVTRDDLYYGIYGIIARYYELKDPKAIERVTKFVARANEVEPLLLHEGQKLILPKTETVQEFILKTNR